MSEHEGSSEISIEMSNVAAEVPDSPSSPRTDESTTSDMSTLHSSLEFESSTVPLLHLTEDNQPQATTDTEATQECNTFTLFPRLPIELRLKVFRETDDFFQPQIIHVLAPDPLLTILRGKGNLRRNIPSALSINREARREALRICVPWNYIEMDHNRLRSLSFFWDDCKYNRKMAIPMGESYVNPKVDMFVFVAFNNDLSSYVPGYDPTIVLTNDEDEDEDDGENDDDDSDDDGDENRDEMGEEKKEVRDKDIDNDSKYPLCRALFFDKLALWDAKLRIIRHLGISFKNLVDATEWVQAKFIENLSHFEKLETLTIILHTYERNEGSYRCEKASDIPVLEGAAALVYRYVERLLEQGGKDSPMLRKPKVEVVICQFDSDMLRCVEIFGRLYHDRNYQHYAELKARGELDSQEQIYHAAISEKIKERIDKLRVKEVELGITSG